MQIINQQAMQAAIDSAYDGVIQDHGGPFGAAIVRGDEIISVAHNTVLRDSDPTCHAEVNAIRKACEILGTHVLDDCELYTTADPCPMCLSATYWARIKKIYIGVNKQVAADFGFDDKYFFEQIALPSEQRSVPSLIGVMQDDCKKVFEKWKALERALY